MPFNIRRGIILALVSWFFVVQMLCALFENLAELALFFSGTLWLAFTHDF